MLKQTSLLGHYGRILLAVVLTAVLAACGGGGTDDILEAAGGGDGGGTGPSTPDGSDDVVRIGNGIGSGFVAGALAADETNLLSGETTTITVNLVDSSGTAVTEQRTITFASDCVSQGLSQFDSTTIDTVSGLATVEYTTAGCSGVDRITATATVNSNTITASVTVTVQTDEVVSIAFVSATENQLSLQGLGGNETSILTFRLVGEQSAPVIGESISFSVNPSTGGVSIVDGRETAVSNANGEVTTVIRSGTTATSVEVTATHDATGVTGLSGDITISTGIPVADRFSLSVSDFAPQSAFNTDGIEVDFNIIASDQFGNPVPDDARVSFVSPESGQITPSCALVDGRCSVKWISASPRPASLRVSIIAFMNGAEAFVDRNGNNIFDAADLNDFTDLAEPCVDENENGICDAASGEFFVDTNSNGVRDAADGVWNGPCLSAASNSAICNTPESIVISRVATLALPTNTPTIIDRGTFPDFTTQIDLTDGLPHVFTGMIIGDALDIDPYRVGGIEYTNNPLPTGTRIVFSDPDGAFNFSGPTSIVVDDHRPTGPFGVSIRTNDIPTPGGGRLVLTVDYPGDGVDTQFIWTTID